VGSENVFNILALGRQTGDPYSPGDAVPATFLYPVEEPMAFDLNRGSEFPKQDRGRNVRNNPGSGYHGTRSASTSLSSQVRFEDIMDILEQCYAGGVVPTEIGGGLYRWDYLFEAGSPTLTPYTYEGGNIDEAAAQMRLLSGLISQLTLSFPDIPSEGAAPWTLSADVMAFDREIIEVTPGLVARPGLEVVQGKYTRLLQGDTDDAYGELVELEESLKSFQLVAQRNLTRRAYGGSGDLPSRFGFSDQSNATFQAKVAVSADTKSDFHDVWNVAVPEPIAERRWRVLAEGGGGRTLWIDARVAILAMPIAEADGERLFEVSGELVDDEFLEGSHQISIVNTLADLDAPVEP
jgi:hypothetical protein